jgi:hypothetical protein
VAGLQDPTSAPWAPDAREEVPWDRPDDFDQPTDTAVGDDQASWDKPGDEAWVDPNPMWPPVANAVGSTATYETADPDDAYAPVLGDVAPTMARAWPETNGHDAERNAATVGQPGYADSQGYADTQGTSETQGYSEPQGQTETPRSVEPPGHTDNQGQSDNFGHMATQAFIETTAPVDSTAVAQPFEDAPLAAWPMPAAPMPAAPVTNDQGPTEWPMPAQSPEQFGAAVAAHMNPAPDDNAPSPAAAPAPAPARESAKADADAGAWLNETASWPSEPPAPDLPPAVGRQRAAEASPAELDFNEPVPDAPVQEAAPAAAPAAPAATPVVVRIELAIVDDQLRVVNSADSPKNVTPDEDELEPVTPRHPDFDPRSSNGHQYEEPTVEAEPMMPLPPLGRAPEQPTWSHEVAPAAIPPATIAAPWAASGFAPAPLPTPMLQPAPMPEPQPYIAPPPPMPEPAPVSYAPWAQNPPAMDPLAAIPAQRFVSQPAPQLQPAPQPQTAPQPVQQVQPIYPAQPVAAAPVFAPPLQPLVQQPAPAPAAAPAPMAAAPYVAPAMAAAAVAPAVAQDQNDLWFLSTEPEDVDAAPDDEDAVAPKEPSTVLTAVLTIGMAILVIVLVLVFFSLMTSLLG